MTKFTKLSNEAKVRLILAYIIIIVSGLALFTAITANDRLGNVENKSQSNAVRITELRHAQINNCEISKRPGGIRYILAAQIKFQLSQSKNVDYHQLFPNFDQQELTRLIKAQKQQEKMEIDQLINVDCAKIYPKITSP